MFLNSISNFINQWGSVIQLITTIVLSSFLLYFAYIQTKLIKLEQKDPQWEIHDLKALKSPNKTSEYTLNFRIKNVGEGRGESINFN